MTVPLRGEDYRKQVLGLRPAPAFERTAAADPRPGLARSLSPSVAGCTASRPPARSGAPPAAVPKGAIPLPPDPAPSGILFRVGLKSDLSRFEFGPPGAVWLLVSSGRAERMRSPLLFAPESGPTVRFAVQAGAFSVESRRALCIEPLRPVPPAAPWPSRRARLYRVLLGECPGRPAAEAFLAVLRERGTTASSRDGLQAVPASLVVTDEAGSVRGCARR